MAVEVRHIEDEITELKLSNKQEEKLIDQLKFIGAKPVKESSRYTYFRFPGNMKKTMNYLGLR